MSATAPAKTRYTLSRRIKWGIYHVARWIVRGVGFFVIRFRVTGQGNVPRTGPVLIVANHLHNFDLIALDAAIPRPVFYMAKRELFRKWLPSFIIRNVGAFPINREGIDRTAIRHAGLLLDEGLVVGILPEGTRSVTHTLQQGNPGAALIAQNNDVPIVPVAVTGTQHLPFDTKHTGEHWLFRPVTVTIGKPFRLPQRRPGQKPDHFAATERIMLEIAALLPPEIRGFYADKLEAPKPAQQD
jgi:1-acyl-sn-glycerol-3-phosphate acyltransferase